MIISISAFAKKSDRAVLIRSDRIREATLKAVYAIPGYKDLPLAEKNRIYDEVKRNAEREV